jgi:hypothetical protein
MRLSVTTEEQQLLVGQTCWLAVAETEPSTHTQPMKETANVHHPDENACGCAVRSRDSFHRPDIDGYACACVRRVRSERPSRFLGRLQIWRPKSGLVPETHRPCGRLWSRWDAVVYPVRRLPSAPPARGRRRRFLRRAFGPQGAMTLDANSDQGCRPSRPLPDAIGCDAKSAPHARRLLSIRPDQFFTYFLMSFGSSEAAKIAPLPSTTMPIGGCIFGSGGTGGGT